MDKLRPPANSKIRVTREAGSQRLSWMRPAGGITRYVAGGLLAMSLCMFCGMLAVIWASGLSEAEPRVIAIMASVGLVGCLFHLALLYLFLRPQKPETIILAPHRFSYHSGSTPFNPLDLPSPIDLFRNDRDRENPLLQVIRRPRRAEFPKSDCPEFVLEHTPAGQRLRFDVGAERVIIGSSLTEPEREWLAEVLSSWRDS